uniref:Putative ribonuclease H-like domain-containing protein n=1 Tax=Tanacetum cinerariifolium TaxID=118510 RepID=A0A6L2K1V0_TANCI|nr:putative ribonuclease H-like domain-containing protein [Tanacetum cinerariifolium]
MQDELLQFRLQKVWRLVDLPKGKHAIGTKWVYRNKKDGRGILVSNKARQVAQGHTQEERINYDEVFSPVARIEAIMLFLAYASFMGFIVYQMDVKSAFLYGTIEEEVYVCQPPGFKYSQFPYKVYKVEKALYGLHQAPKAWYETLSTYLLENGFRKRIIDKTLFIKKDKCDILLVQVYVDNIIFGSTKKLCIEFEGSMHKKFQMSYMGELTFFLGLQVMQRDNGIFISQDKYVADILKKFNFSSVKITSTPIETNKTLLKDEEAEDVGVHLYRSIIRSLMYLIASRPDIMFVVCACARFQVTHIVSHLHVVKRIFRYLKGQPKLGLWYPRDSPFDLEAFLDSNYAGASHGRKCTTRGCQFLGKRLISWQYGISDAFGVKTGSCKVNAARQDLVLLGQNKIKISRTVTPLFASMLVPQVVKGEGSGQPFEPQPPSSTAPPSHEEQVTVVASQPQNTYTPRRTKRVQDNEIPQSSGPPKKLGDEVVYTGEDDRVVRATTTVTSLEADQESGNINKTQSTTTLNEPSPHGIGLGRGPKCQDTTLGDVDAQTRFETASIQFHDPPLLEVNTSRSGEDRGHTPGSDEGRPNINELMAICTQFSNMVLALEQSKTTQDLSLDKENVSKQGRNLKTRPMFEEGNFDDDFDDIDDMVDEAMKNVKGDTVNAGGAVNTATTGVSAASVSVTTVGVSISTAEPKTPLTTTTTSFKDEDLTIAQTLVKMRSKKAKEKGVAFIDVEESARPTTILPTIDPKDKGKGIMQEPKKPPKNPRMAQIQLGEELAKRMDEEEMAKLEKRQSKIAVTEEASKAVINQKLDDIQAMIEADEKMASRLQSEEQEQFTIEEKSRMLVEMIAERKRFFAVERLAEQKKVVKNRGKKDDSSSKQPGSKKKRAVQDEDRAINYETLAMKSPIIDWESQLLGSDLQKEDLSYWKTTRADGSFRFYKKYPLTKEMLTRMLNSRLEADLESTMAFELIRFIKVQVCAAAED